VRRASKYVLAHGDDLMHLTETVKNGFHLWVYIMVVFMVVIDGFLIRVLQVFLEFVVASMGDKYILEIESLCKNNAVFFYKIKEQIREEGSCLVIK
jgi:hypothetical protein